MIEVRCPRCNKELQFADSLRGQAISCPNCNQKIRIFPRPAEDQEPAFAEVVDPDEKDRTPHIGVRAKRLRPERFRKRRRGDGGFLAEQFHYWTGAVGGFGFVLARLALCWLALTGLGLVFPPAASILLALGTLLYLVGWLWVVFV